MSEVIVIGAGLSGLVCATRLLAAGVEVRVLEANARVGGRLHTSTIGGAIVDLGGQWMSVGQPRLVALAQELGVASRPQLRGRQVVTPRVGFRAAFAQWRAIRRIKKMIANPPTADESVAAFLGREIGNPTARALIALHAELIFAVDLGVLSLHDYLARLAATGDFAPRGPELPGGGREHRFVDGAQTLALRLAERIGDRVELGVRVAAIAQTADDVRVDDRVASRVVLALPPTAACAIDIELPAETRAYRMGAVVKCFAAFDEPIAPREQFFTDGPIRAAVPLAEDLLVAFVVGPHAERWHARDPAERRALVSETLGLPAPSAYLEADWTREGGCVASLPPGVRASWREPHGRIHIAGTESAVAWPGYMEGAIEAGERAAAEILASPRE